MKIYEIGTGYTSIPAKMGAATEIVVEELTRAMLKQGCDVTIVDIKDKHRQPNNLPIEEVYMPQFFSTGHVVKLGVIHKVKRVLYSLSLTMKLHRLIKNHSHSEKICLHFHNQYNLYFFLKLTPKKMRERLCIGYTVHSYIWFGNWEDIKETVNRRYFQEVFCCRHADKVFVLNDIVANMLMTHYDVLSSNIYKVINGVNTDRYYEGAADEGQLATLRKQYHLNGKKIVFQVGSICDRKNQLGTLELLLPMMKQDKNLVFAYAGGVIDQLYADQIREKAQKEGIENQVIYYGEVSPGERLNLLYSLANVCVMNSKSEAFALVMAEALSIPRPIFINQQIISSLPFLRKNIGNGILLIDDNFSDQLCRLLDDKDYYETLKRRGRIFIKEEYSWDVAARQYLSCFS